MRALLSVSDKTGLVAFARRLSSLGIDLVSTGGTARVLREANLAVIDVASLTGFPEALDGRVKTLHPAIHAAILAKRNDPAHMAFLQAHGITPIDMVVVNLYPFKETVAREGITHDEAIEEIDIGGPTLLRAAAKAADDVIVLCDPADYESVATELEKTGTLTREERRALQVKVFRHTASYDAAIAAYLSSERHDDSFPEELTLSYEKTLDARYGENPHQRGAVYATAPAEEGTIPAAKVLHGKVLSYNNVRDADDALSLLKEFATSLPTAVATKHGNPCGVASADTLIEAYRAAHAADPVSIYGGILALSGEVDEPLAKELVQTFLEVVIAPSFTAEALTMLEGKKNLRLLSLPSLMRPLDRARSFRSIAGGMIIQEEDQVLLNDSPLSVVSRRKPTDEELRDLLFAWKVVKHAKSNAIVLARHEMTVGIGPGQVNRVWCVEDAIRHAQEFFGEDGAKGSVLASDAFFPFGDSLERASRAGITAVIEPGGSIRDQESIDVADEQGIALVFTGMRHFRH